MIRTVPGGLEPLVLLLSLQCGLRFDGLDLFFISPPASIGASMHRRIDEVHIFYNFQNIFVDLNSLQCTSLTILQPTCHTLAYLV
jgi:hypothetical protein